MSNMFNDEKVLCSIKSYKKIKNSTILTNVFANFISRGFTGKLTYDFNLILTTDSLYVETMERTAFGGLTETIHIDKILRKDIRSFEVKIEGSEEIIVINTEDDKTISFIKNNENNDLALEMAKLITRN